MARQTIGITRKVSARARAAQAARPIDSLATSRSYGMRNSVPRSATRPIIDGSAKIVRRAAASICASTTAKTTSASIARMKNWSCARTSAIQKERDAPPTRCRPAQHLGEKSDKAGICQHHDEMPRDDFVVNPWIEEREEPNADFATASALSTSRPLRRPRNACKHNRWRAQEAVPALRAARIATSRRDRQRDQIGRRMRIRAYRSRPRAIRRLQTAQERRDRRAVDRPVQS